MVDPWRSAAIRYRTEASNALAMVRDAPHIQGIGYGESGMSEHLTTEHLAPIQDTLHLLARGVHLLLHGAYAMPKYDAERDLVQDSRELLDKIKSLVASKSPDSSDDQAERDALKSSLQDLKSELSDILSDLGGDNATTSSSAPSFGASTSTLGTSAPSALDTSATASQSTVGALPSAPSATGFQSTAAVEATGTKPSAAQQTQEGDTAPDDLDAALSGTEPVATAKKMSDPPSKS